MLVDADANDIVYSSLFSGVHGNYLKPSVAKAGFDPENLPEGSKDLMDFTKGDKDAAKAWRDIWSAGQGVGSIDAVMPVGELVLQMQWEYEATRERLGFV
jgi:nitronate monooxygenase